MKIEIGSGHLLTPGYTALDPIHGEGEWRRLAQDAPWPTGDNTVEAIRASHVMEHIPAGQPRVAVFNEAHRVLSPGGTFEIIVPLIAAHGQPIHTWHAWADYAHVSYWVLPESWLYMTGQWAPNAETGILRWEDLRDEDMEVRSGWEGHVVMRKP